MTILCFKGKFTLHRAERSERETTLRSTDLCDLADAFPELRPVWEELQYRRNEMQHED